MPISLLTKAILTCTASAFGWMNSLSCVCLIRCGYIHPVMGTVAQSQASPRETALENVCAWRCWTELVLSVGSPKRRTEEGPERRMPNSASKTTAQVSDFPPLSRRSKADNRVWNHYSDTSPSTRIHEARGKVALSPWKSSVTQSWSIRAVTLKFMRILSPRK